MIGQSPLVVVCLIRNMRVTNSKVDLNIVKPYIKPSMLNEISRPYQLDEFISNLGLLGSIFHFHSNFKKNVCKQTGENLIRRRVLWHLIWFFTVCRCYKRTLGLYGFIYILTNKCQVSASGTIVL